MGSIVTVLALITPGLILALANIFARLDDMEMQIDMLEWDHEIEINSLKRKLNELDS